MIGRPNKLWMWMTYLTSLFFLLLNTNLSFSAEIDEIRRAINSHGAKWIAQENPISLLPEDQRRMRLGALEEPAFPEGMTNKFSYAPASVPSAFDWRNVSGNNFVTPVRDQGNCGDCWAFAVTAALESKALINFNWSGTNLNLSEQIVLSCSGAGSCDGGSPTTASRFLTTTGTNLESCYPYTAQNGNCTSACPNWQDSTYKINNWSYISNGSSPAASALKNAIYSSGPVVAVFDVYTDFFSYSSGVYSYVSGNYEGGHAILIVGWDDADSAFIVKNSWGTYWGESGYFRIAYSKLTGKTKFAQTSYSYGDVPPVSFSYVSPLEGASQQPAEVELDWEDSVGATSYDVYFGTTNPPPFLINKTSSSHDPGTLNSGKTYYWQIISKNSGGNTAGAIWSFTTAVVDTTSPLPPTGLKVTGFAK